MILTLQQKKSVGDRHSSVYPLSLVFSVLLFLILLSGCENADDKTSLPQHKSVPIAVAADLTTKAKSIALDNKQGTSVFAPTVDNKRTDIWLGGAPPINKRASGINTYYHIKPEGNPNQIVMTLRFEGIKFDDARVEFRTLDGAKFKEKDQQTQWRLKANTASEVTFTIVVPDGISYLSLDTFQNNQGASRAFILKVPEKMKR
ncbi:hypothetical protein L3081_23370 [Colwellia sp. MSW7]|jgi:hypothetical protein|uniref:Discoidin domain-containing protein n=1 Tax=Colwellia maritima TaxID=2912588 RepID=A0ABS9X6S6_9GAMM|nr:hypothetical protein [Colwellia maritima]MCI2285780.1 hypothetical protein [Colwellia maritima]